MSKERLEEIERHAEHKSIMPMYPMHDRPIKNTTSIRTKDYDWLIKQAERTEQNKKDWLNAMKRLENYEKVSSLNHEEIQRLRDQIKRYRERIEYMLEEAKDHKEKGLTIQHWALIKDLEETLEGDSYEPTTY